MSGFLEVKMSGVVQVASPITSIERKKCSKCGEVKKCSEFSKESTVKSGLKSQCKTCRLIRERVSYRQMRMGHQLHKGCEGSRPPRYTGHHPDD